MNLYTNLNLDEKTKQLLAEKGGIKCLADKEIAIENDDYNALVKVYNGSGGRGDCLPKSVRYFIVSRSGWIGYDLLPDNLPSIPASILVQELEGKPFEWGERVWVSDDSVNWKEALYIDKRDSKEFPFTALCKGHYSTIIWNYCQREKPKPSPLRITPEMIREKFGCQEFEIVNEKA